MSLSSFPKGGIHPADRKGGSNQSEIVTFSIPQTVVVPFSQHLGAPAKPVVAVGDQVKEGGKIADASSFVSANVHSPVSGKITAIKDIFLANGISSAAAVIEVDTGFVPSLYNFQETRQWRNTAPKELLDQLQAAGIVGLGGATFPAHVKFSVPKGEKAEYLVINGVECEPYITADHRLMLEKSAELVEGIAMLQKIVAADKVVVGIENNKADAIEKMRMAFKQNGLTAAVLPLAMKYPQGDEKQLLKAAIGREVLSGGLPIHIGAVVSNISSVYAVYQALKFGQPMIERVVTVSGDAIVNPGNYLVRIGTPIASLIERCGGFRTEPARLIVGGPMMGFAIHDLSTPIIKGSSAILALSEKAVKQINREPCLSCGRCLHVCPMGLSPSTMFKAIDHMLLDQAKEEGLLDCKECGCCAFTCPSAIPLVHGFRRGKLLLRKRK